MSFANQGRNAVTTLNAAALGACLLLAACSGHSRAALDTGSGPVACTGGSVQSAPELARYQGCETVEGDLRIEAAELENVDALASLRHVSGALSIANAPDLENVEGLENLRSVQRIEIENAPRLVSLRGLEGLQALDALEVQRTGVRSLTGLEGLREVGTLEIVQNPHLISLRALNGLEHAKSVRLELNPRLAAQPGLLPAIEIERALVVKQNPGLTSYEVARLSSRLRPPAAFMLALRDDQL